ncbi:MAG: ATP-binding cassette domain-containing protein [Labilibaculum sp.]|nr:ATP-binding cassette domain-containing protein [Labilibaculum sp.]MBI9059906.1 ATP-binding cassette domain-containing protein [Labilibaculum sp.]
MIKCKNINLSFPQQVICEDLSFEIATGEFICFSGPSGKGKSSLLKMLMGFLLPQSGEIEIDGLELNSENIEMIRSSMIWLPQNINLPVDSGSELMELLQMNEEQKESFRSFLDQLGVLACGEENSFTEISGGQKQRIVMAACLSLNKTILLLDEPVSALDDHSIDLLFATLDSLKNTTIISTSHNEKWINYCNRSIKL